MRLWGKYEMVTRPQICKRESWKIPRWKPLRSSDWWRYTWCTMSSRTRHRVLDVATVDRTLSMVSWRWHISVSGLCFCSMAVSFSVASFIVWVCFGVLSRECRSLN
jgi:hypothetical protein